MRILAAVICCDFKRYSLSECLDSIFGAGFKDILLNYEYDKLGVSTPQGVVNMVQMWKFYETDEQNRQFDQDQSYRLPRIVTARNMCIDYAIKHDYDYIFFVDSDVLIPDNTREVLFAEDFKLMSGLVSGRGHHSGARYMFGELNHCFGDWYQCEYATCGFTAIHRDIFRRVRFKWGEPFEGGALCSEDPLYGADVRHLYNIGWMVNTALKAEHVDNPNRPMIKGQESQY